MFIDIDLWYIYNSDLIVKTTTEYGDSVSLASAQLAVAYEETDLHIFEDLAFFSMSFIPIVQLNKAIEQ